MSLVKWEMNNKTRDDIIIDNTTNGIKIIGGRWGGLRVNKPITEGKYYLELTVEDLGYSTIGFASEETYLNNNNWLGENCSGFGNYRDSWAICGSSFEGNDLFNIKNSIISVIIDLNSGYMQMMLDGKEIIDGFNFGEKYNGSKIIYFAITKSNASSSDVIIKNTNFGTEPFKYLSNELKEEGYLPYDLENAHKDNLPYKIKYLYYIDGNYYNIIDSKLNKINYTNDINSKLILDNGFTDFTVMPNKKFKIYSSLFDNNDNLIKDKDINIKIIKNRNLFNYCENGKILTLSDKNNNQNLKIKGFKDLRKLGCDNSKILVVKDKERDDIPLALPYGYTSPQLVIPTGDIRLQKVSKINSLQIKANDDEELVRIIYSIDGGETWHSKKPNQPIVRNFIDNSIDIKNIDDIIENGMTIKEFNSINEGWTEEILKNGKIRFAYLLQLDDINTRSEVDKLEINMSMYGSWLSQVHDEEFNYEYDNDKLILKVYNDGTYKFNYFG